MLLSNSSDQVGTKIPRRLGMTIRCECNTDSVALMRQPSILKGISYHSNMNKSKVIETLEKLPEEFSTEELIDKLIFIEKVEQGLKDSDEGRVISLDEAKKRMAKKW